jgi:glycosyltransferase involved in cell wall biosynthesis
MLKNLELKVHEDDIKFDYHILKGGEIFFNHREFTLHLNRGFLRLLIKENPHVIVSLGYSYLESILGLFYAKVLGKKFVLWSGSTLHSSMSKHIAIRKIKEMVIKRCDSFLAYGSNAADYLIRYGANESKVVVGCNTIAVNYFIAESSQLAWQKEEIKREKKWPAKIILFSGQLIPRKNLDVLLEALKKIDKDDIGLVILGDGPLRNNYVAWCRKNQLKNVFFEGFRPVEDLPIYYATADIFVMPSLREVWGLVVNEAMASGLPVLCSNKAGVANDLVKDEFNGYTFDPKDSYGLKNMLVVLLNDEKKRKKMGRNSLQIIRNCTPEKYAEDLLKAIDLATCNLKS